MAALGQAESAKVECASIFRNRTLGLLVVVPGMGVVHWSPAARAAQKQRERVSLLAGQRRGGGGQPGDVGIQAGLAVIVGAPVMAIGLVGLVMRGWGQACPG